MARTFSVNPFFQLVNRLVSAGIKAGIPIGSNAVLIVPGRKSGEPRETPITIIHFGGERYITSPFGESQWVRNLRAARSAKLRTGKRVEPIQVEELAAEDAAPVLRETLNRAPKYVRDHYDVQPGASLADFERDAPNHPVFRIVSEPTTA